MIGTLKRDCLHHFVFVSEGHLRRVLAEYREYYNRQRPHQGIGSFPVAVGRGPPEEGREVVESVPVLGGLHHDYRYAA